MAKATKKEVKITMEDIKTLRLKTSAGIGLCKEALVETEGDMEKASEYINKKSDAISRLHNLTGAKIGLCKIALTDAGGDFEKATEIINEQGWADASSVGGQESKAKEGLIEAYVHGTDRKTVALVELTCQTDFVARNEDFRNLAHEIALHVAAMKPKYVSKEEIPAEKLEEAKKLFEREAKEEGKPENILPKIVEGKLNKFYEDNCLLTQKWFKDENKTIQNLFDEYMTKLGEPMQIRRILVWKLGE